MGQLAKFDGNNMSVSVWAEQIRMVQRMYQTAPEVLVELAILTLQGDAKTTVILRPSEQRQTFEQVVQILETIYGETALLGSLVARFFQRVQKENESLPQYANALQELLRDIQEKERGGSPAFCNPDRTLRDQFVLGIRDGSLTVAMQDFIRRETDAKFHDVQVEAISRANSMVQKPQTAVGVTLSQGASSGPETTEKGTVKEILTVMQKLQEQMEHLQTSCNENSMRIAGLQKPRDEGVGRSHQEGQNHPQSRWRDEDRTYRRGPNRWPERREIRCWECGRIGHIAARCPEQRQAYERPPLN